MPEGFSLKGIAKYLLCTILAMIVTVMLCAGTAIIMHVTFNLTSDAIHKIDKYMGVK